MKTLRSLACAFFCATTLPLHANTPRFYLHLDLVSQPNAPATLTVHTSAELLDRLLNLPRPEPDFLATNERTLWLAAAARQLQQNLHLATPTPLPELTFEPADDIGQPELTLIPGAHITATFALPEPETLHWTLFPAQAVTAEQTTFTPPRTLHDVLLLHRHHHPTEPLTRAFLLTKNQPKAQLHTSTPAPTPEIPAPTFPHFLVFPPLVLAPILFALFALVLLALYFRRRNRNQLPQPLPAIATLLLLGLSWLGLSWLGHRQQQRQNTLSPSAIAPALQHLLDGTYRAFDHTTQPAIYRQLQRHIHDPAFIETLFLEITRQQQTGQPIHILNVTLHSCTPASPSRTTTADPRLVPVTAVWDVAGFVGHRNHQHKRIYRNTAELTLRADPASGWRIDHATLTKKQPLLDETSWTPNPL